MDSILRDRLIEKYNGYLEIFIALSISNVNHRPHPFTIGAKHVIYAHDNCAGELGEEAARAHPCARRGCSLPYDKHTFDTILFVQLTRSCTKEEARTDLLKIADDLEEDGIDGIAIVENKRDFSIT